MLDYLPWAIVHLGALALILVCAAGLGNLFLRKHRFDNLAKRSVFTVSLGLGLGALVLFILGLLGILYQSLIWVLTVSGAVATVSHSLYSHRGSLGIRQWRQVLRVQQWNQLYTLRRAVTALLIILAVSCWVLLLKGLPPATSEARETFLTQLNGYRGVEYVNAHANKTDTVGLLNASWLNYYFDQRVID